MPKDILLDETIDLAIVNGDFAVGESAVQHLDLLMQSNKGDWKEYPLAGVDLNKSINSTMSLQNTDSIAKQIKLQMEMDGFTGVKINGNADDMQITANEL